MENVGDALPVPVPGKEVTTQELVRPILEKIRDICGWSPRSFPGSQPVSLTRTNMRDLNSMAYVACEKTDGVRYLLYVASNRAWLIDRKETIQSLDINIPKKFGTDRQQGTLLDGELVTDIVKRKQEDGSVISEPVARYLIYDGIAIDGISIARLNLLERLRVVYQDVIKPRREWEKKNPETVQKEKNDQQYLGIYLKDFFEIWDITAISNFSNRLPHLSDGIIFTPVEFPYMPGTCRQLLKWKPPHLNSVDFYGEIVTKSAVAGAQGNASSKKEPVAVKLSVSQRGLRTFTGLWLALEGKKYKDLFARFSEGDTSVSGTIWECYYDFDATTVTPKTDSDGNLNFESGEVEKGGWCVERLRTDKKMPNDERVVKSVFESICDGVSFEELVDEFYEYREGGKPALAESCQVPDYYKKHSSPVTRGKWPEEREAATTAITTSAIAPTTTS